MLYFGFFASSQLWFVDSRLNLRSQEFTVTIIMIYLILLKAVSAAPSSSVTTQKISLLHASTIASLYL